MIKQLPLGIKILILTFIFFLFDAIQMYLPWVQYLITHGINLADYALIGSGIGCFLGSISRAIVSIILPLIAVLFLATKNSKVLLICKIAFLWGSFKFTTGFARGLAGGFSLATYLICYLVLGVIAFKVFKFLNKEKIKEIYLDS